jgi:hypothetical protein
MLRRIATRSFWQPAVAPMVPNEARFALLFVCHHRDGAHGAMLSLIEREAETAGGGQALRPR